MRGPRAWLVRAVGLVPISWLRAIGRLQWKHRALGGIVRWGAGVLKGGDATIQHGAGRGLRFNPGPSNAGYLLGTTEPGIQKALAMLLHPGMTFYDIGANVGFLSVIGARLVGAEGTVIAFEPVPANADLTNQNAHLNGFSHLLVCSLAVGREDGEARFVLSSNPNWGKLAAVAGDAAEQQDETTVSLRRLDTVVRERELSAPDVIKIDVEGAEVDVLAGAEETLRRSRPAMVIELHGTNREVEEALDRLGYRAAVLGSRSGVGEARWDAQVLAVPRERTSLDPTVDRLTDPGYMGEIR